jgi:hypothetical protein
MKPVTFVNQKTAWVLVAIISLLAACRKKEDANPPQLSQEQVARLFKTNLSVVNSFGDVIGRKDKAKSVAANGRFTEQTEGDCPVISYSIDNNGGFGAMIAVDYGNGCPADPFNQKGKAAFKYFYSASNITNIALTYTNYRFLTSGLDGTAKASYLYDASFGNRFDSETINLRVADSLNGTYNYNSQFVYKQVNGHLTPWNPFDDIYEISGAGTSVNNQNIQAKFEITQPLVQKFNCHYIVSGKAKLTVPGTDASIDFGNGTCDNTATVTINGNTFVVYL